MAIPDWLILSRVNGSGDTMVTVTADNYTQLVARTASLVVSGNTKSVTIPVNQDYRVPDFTITPTSVEIMSASSSFNVTVDSELSWTASTNENWITFSPSSGGSGVSTVQVNINTNTGGLVREGNVSFHDGYSTLACNVLQTGRLLDVDTNTLNFDYGENLSRKVRVYSYNTNWSVTSVPEWITVGPTAGTAGYTDMWVIADRMRTDSGDTRNGVIALSNGSETINISVYQIVESMSMGYSGSMPVPQSGGTKTFGVDSATTISWTATTDSDWFTFSPTSGNSRTQVTITVTADTNTSSDSRVANIVFESIDEHNTGRLFVQHLCQPGTGAYGNVIYYKSANNNVIQPYAYSRYTQRQIEAYFGATLVSNTYSDGQGVLTFGSQIAHIPRQAFLSDSLTEFIIPSTVKVIGKEALRLNHDLSAITIPSSVKYMDDYAFYQTELTAVTVPVGITSLELNVFGDCHYLKSISLPEGLEVIKRGALTSSWAMSGPLNIPSTVRRIDGGAFDATFADSIVIPEGVTHIADGLFTQSRLVTITLPSTTKTVGGTAFYLTHNLLDLYVYARTAPVITSTSLEYIGHSNNPYGQTNGVLHYPAGSDYSTWIAQLPPEWTAVGDL